jgi:lipopolysaccharide assembly outer membrane protein LptD (OstA)
MKPFASTCVAALCLTAVITGPSVFAQEEAGVIISALSEILPGTAEGKVEFDAKTGTVNYANGIFVTDGKSVLTADSAAVNTKTGDVVADGNVHIESGDQLWVGEHISYNFKTKLMRSEQFRTGKSPVFAGGNELTGDRSNKVYSAKRAFVTTDDVSEPLYRVKASRIKVIPGQSVQMWHAVLYVGDVPMFYFPYYQRNLGPRGNNFTTTPGYRSRYGGYLLNTYTWFLGDVADGKLHIDYRERRGVGAGPDINLHLERWGDLSLKYYYQNDARPNSSTNAFPQFGSMPQNRQRFYAGWQATPATNLNFKALVNYQSDPLFLHDFFEGDYSLNPQPSTFIEANKYWNNWSLDALVTPRINNFFNQVERLPDLKLTGFRQQILGTPLYYDSESSLGWYHAYVANTTNGLYPFTNGYFADSAARADTYHQVSLPWVFFNKINVAPYVGGRFTYYSRRSDASSSSDETYRGVLTTGLRTSFKATRLWTGVTNSFWDVDGLRHVIEPSADYVFIPRPSAAASQLPQFDSENPSLLLSPVLLGDYNSIDSITSQNVVRFGLRNLLQTKRGGALDELVNWNVMLDWRLDPNLNQSPVNDLYSRFAIRPRRWLTAESQLRYDLDHGDLNLAFHQLTFAPGDRWSWGIGHWYLRGGNWGNNAWGENNFISSTLFYRVNDNWGLRATHNYNSANGRLQEQFYTIYRDLRSFTGALTFRVLDEPNHASDFTVAFMLSLKASPSVRVGEDTVNPFRL